tara:strand:- start:627 stop:1292 length:666 start_codon:yes stop_codon:yes gene_type:complete
MARLTAEQIRNQFNLSYNDKHANSGPGGAGYDSEHGGRDDGAIFSTDTGEYIGTLNNFSPKDDSNYAQGINQYEKIQDYGIENGLDKTRKKWNSMNDVAGAANAIYLKEAEEIEKAAKPAPPEPEPIQLSKTAAKAIGRAAAYQDTLMVRDGDYTIGGDETVIADFNKQAKENTEYMMQPKMPNEMYNPRQEAAQERANNYKLAVADQLSPKNRLILNKSV